MIPRSFVSDVRIMVYTLLCSMIQQFTNPWTLDSSAFETTDATATEVKSLVRELEIMQQMAERLGEQARRTLAILRPSTGRINLSRSMGRPNDQIPFHLLVSVKSEQQSRIQLLTTEAASAVYTG